MKALLRNLFYSFFEIGEVRNMYLRKTCKYICISIISILLIIYSLRFVTIFDEDYSLILIHHSYLNILKLDSLDVHPPLFYILLKIFLQITTFWNNSLLVKILFARIFSILVSIITFVFLFKLGKKIFNYNISLISEFLIFLIVPGVITFTCEFIKIRMYALGAMFITIELYELYKYSIEYKKNSYLIIAVLMSILSAYTHYYAAIISGLILVFYLMLNLLKHNNKTVIRFICSVIILICSFIPWAPVLLKQLSLQYYHPLGGFFKQWVATLFLIMIFIYPLCWSYKHLDRKFNDVFLCTFFVNIFLFIFSSVVSIIDQSVFQFRYFYPIYLIYGFLGINVLVLLVDKHQNTVKYLYSLIIIFMVSLMCVGSYISQTRYYGTLSSNIVRNFKEWPKSDKKIINTKTLDKVDQGPDIERAMYVSSLHKYIIFNKSHTLPKNIKNVLFNPSYKDMFSNIRNHII